MAGIHSVSGIDDDSYDIDKWVGEDDDPYCYACQDWVDLDSDGRCPKCGEEPEEDKWKDSHTAVVHSSSAPHVTSTGDIWNRGSGYTWGGGSSWWSDGYGDGALTSMWSSGGYRHVNDDARILKNKRHIDSLLKVVDPTVKHTLSFGIRGAENYTNMNNNHIVVDGSLIQSDDTNLDIVAGVGIHEKLHCIHSHPLVKWQKEKAYEICETTSQTKLFHTISNIIEDEYIERQLGKTCAGYVHYLEKTKKFMFERDATDILGEDIESFGDVINTLLMLVRYPSMIDDNRKKKHAPHIRFFARALINGIESRSDTYKSIESIYRYLIRVAKKHTTTKSEDEILDEATARAEKRLGGYEEDWTEGSVTDEDREKILASMLADELKNLRRRERRKDGIFIPDVIDKMTGKDEDRAFEEGLSKELSERLKELEDTDYEETDLERGIALRGQRRITWKRAISDPHSKRIYQYDKSEVKAQIQKLKRKIDLYGNRQVLTLRNQKRGRLDKRLLHKIPMGMTDLFKGDIINEDKPLDVCLLVDESGSMGSGTMAYARQSAIALKEALGSNPMINLWVYGHTADLNYKNYETNMTEYWSPSMKDRPMAMGGMKAQYENRDGNAIVASADRIKGESDNGAQKLMIILSDGAPSAEGYRGDKAHTHTKRCVKHVERNGWTVIQVGFAGSREYYMEKMFTNWLYVNDLSKLGDQVSKIIRKVVQV